MMRLAVRTGEGTVLLRASGVGAVLLVALSAASPAAARVVEYLDDMAAIRAAADDQGITGSFSEPPDPGNALILLETPTAADHRVVVGSNYCQAYHIENPVSVLLQNLADAANRTQVAAAGPDSRPVLSLRILSGSTLLRCMGKSDVETLCKNRVRITAEASFKRPDGAIVTTPVVAQIERNGRVGGFCGNIARYTGIVTREAGIDLIRRAREVSGE